MRRISVVVLAAAAAVLLSGTGASADDGPASVDKTTVRPGECVTFSGTEFVPATPVRVERNDDFIRNVTSDAQGSFSTEICFGADTPIGEYQLAGTGTGFSDDTYPQDFALPAPDSGTLSVVRTSYESAVLAQARPTERRVVSAVVRLVGVLQRDDGDDGGGGTGGLPRTGVQIGLIFLIGLLAVSAGAIVTSQTRRRRA